MEKIRNLQPEEIAVLQSPLAVVPDDQVEGVFCFIRFGRRI